MSQRKIIQHSFLMITLMLCLAMAISACATALPKVEMVSALPARTEPPKWIMELEYNPDVIETVGYSTEMSSIEFAFNRSAHRARAEMANVLSSVIRSSIVDSILIDGTLDSEVIESIYKEVTRLYAAETMSGIAIVARYIDTKTGMIYSLARLRRADAIKDASIKARLAIRREKSLFDELVLDSEIRSRLKPGKAEFIEATGLASVRSNESEKIKPSSYESAMMHAELNARVALAQRVRVKITNDVRSWVEEHEDSFGNSLSVNYFLESISKSFTEVKLEGSRIMKRHFSPDTNMVYVQAVMDKKWLASEFAHAAAPAIDKSGKAGLEEDLNRVIHNSLDVLIKGSTRENIPDIPEP